MISKNSFLTSMKENCKRRSWIVVVSLLSFFFYFPVTLMIVIQATLREGERYGIAPLLKEIYIRIFQFENWSIFITAVIAILCAVQGFSYLYKRKKVDLYHSVPVSKAKRFGVIYLNGILIFVGSYLLNFALGYLVVSMYDGIRMDVFMTGMKGFFGNMLFFLCIYHISILAVMMTGNLIATLLAGVVFFSYEIVIKLVVQGLQSIYFFTYTGDYDMTMNTLFSPLGTCITFFSDVRVNPYDFAALSFELFILALIWGFFAYVAYYFRPLEASGRTMAFEKSKGIIKILVMIPTSLLIAMFFYSISSASEGMGIFGLIVGILLSHALIECVYEFDLSAIFHKKRQLLLGGVLTAILFILFRFDLTGYDSYIPKAEKIESVGVFLTDNELSVYDASGRYYSMRDHLLESVRISNPEPILLLAQKGVEYTAKDFGTNNGYHPYITVCYNLTSGKKVYRHIAINYEDEESLNAIASIYNDMEYKESAYQIVGDTFFADYVNMEITCGDGIVAQKLSDVVTQELIMAYRRDIAALDYKTKAAEIPSAVLIFSYTLPEKERYSRQDLRWDYPVYDSFTETIAILEKEKVFPVAQITAEEIYEIKVTCWEGITNSTDELLILQTKEGIEQILPYLTSEKLQSFSNANYYEVEGMEYEITIWKQSDKRVDPYNESNVERYIFKNYIVPDVISEKMKQSQK